MKKILFLVTEDWYFLSHRLPLAIAAKNIGYEIHVACRDSGRSDEIKKHGLNYHELINKRGYSSPVNILGAVKEIKSIIKIVNPSIMHAVSIQGVVLGLLAALFNKKIKVIAAITGLGSIFLAKSYRGKILKSIISLFLFINLKKKNITVIVQNKDDKNFVANVLKCDKKRIFIVRGSGINLDYYKVYKQPKYPPINITYVGRIIKDKGIEEIIKAFNIAKASISNIKLLIAGSFDANNFSKFNQDYFFKEIKNNKQIEYLGELKEVRPLWKNTHIAILASEREGLPKSLLEAASMGRAIIASDVAGCREIAINGVNAITYKKGNIEELAKAIIYLSTHHKIRENYGFNSRKLVESDMSEDRVIKKTLSIYQALVF
jgi:glycosyltransferase involved in cell wall biosynthesis